jgi:hypothetical protein
VSAALQGVLAVQGWVRAAGRSTSSATAGCAPSTTWRDGASTAGVTQVGHDTPGRVYYQRKIAEGKSKKEAATRPHAPHQRRRMASAPSRPRPPLTRPGRTTRADSSIQRGRHPEHWHFGASHSRTRPPRYARAQALLHCAPETPLTPRGFDPRARRRHDPPQNEVSDRPYSVVRLRPHRTLRGQVENARGTGDLYPDVARPGTPNPRSAKGRAEALAAWAGPRRCPLPLRKRARLPEPRTPSPARSRYRTTVLGIGRSVSIAGSPCRGPLRR